MAPAVFKSLRIIRSAEQKDQFVQTELPVFKAPRTLQMCNKRVVVEECRLDPRSFSPILVT